MSIKPGCGYASVWMSVLAIAFENGQSISLTSEQAQKYLLLTVRAVE
jgi:hypothetical protein